MGAIRIRIQDSEGEMSLTLLELVDTLADLTDDDAEIVATVVHLLRSGRVRLCGSFRGSRLDAA